MATRDDGGPAFPLGITSEMESVGVSQEGMSLRDWFAGRLLTQLAYRIGADTSNNERAERMFGVASQCYTWADVMLAARK